MTNTDLVAQAATIGKQVSKSDAEAFRKGWTSDLGDDLHHPGDDTGRLMCAAFKTHGAPGAADVLDAYLDAYNAVRRDKGLPEVQREVVARHIGWAASVGASDAEIAEMSAEFKRRHGIA